MRKFGKHVRGHFVAYLALFFALGGTSIAAVNALPKNSVSSRRSSRRKEKGKLCEKVRRSCP